MAIHTLESKDVALPLAQIESFLSDTKTHQHFLFKDFSSHARAWEALEFSLALWDSNFNAYVESQEGRERMNSTLACVRTFLDGKPTPSDWIYLQNFSAAHQALAFEIPAGLGREFKDDMKQCIAKLTAAWAEAFSEESYMLKSNALVQELDFFIHDVVVQLNQYATENHLEIRKEQDGSLVCVYVQEDGQRIALADVPKEKQPELEKIWENIQKEFHAIAIKTRDKRIALATQQRALVMSVAEAALLPIWTPLKEKYESIETLRPWITELQADLLRHIVSFVPSLKALLADDTQPIIDPEVQYGVNVLVEHTAGESPPVILESTPTPQRLVGEMKYSTITSGGVETNFLMITPGSLHRAAGGVLILRVEALVRAPQSWEVLKKVLRTGVIEIEDRQNYNGVSLIDAPRPQPIPLRAQVILVGSPRWFYSFFYPDADFHSFFKIKADIEDDMLLTQRHAILYADFMRHYVEEKLTVKATAEALSFVVAMGTRWAQHRQRLTSAFEMGMNLLCEAKTIARTRDEASPMITLEDLRHVLANVRHRNRVMQDRYLMDVKEGVTLIQTKGSAVGEINGLTVRYVGAESFGMPSRISCRTHMGRRGVVNIERVINMSGPYQEKSVEILQGYMGGIFAQSFPLSFTATLTFEQLYSELDGDSASLAEIAVLLSSLGDVAIRQDRAITGSMDQMGRVQAVGGVIEKIEGFFETCSVQGLTGTQGVIIPQSNVDHLVLRPEVVEAIAAGKFTIWAISHIEEGLSLLMDTKINDISDPKSLFGRVFKKLKGFNAGLKQVCGEPMQVG